MRLRAAAGRVRRLLRPPRPEPPRLSFGSWDRLPAADPLVVGVCHPAWRGVRTAAYTYRTPMVEAADLGRDGPALAEAMAGAGVAVVVVQGLPPGSEALVREAHRRGLATRCLLHSSMVQQGAEPGEAEVMGRVLALLEEGSLHRLGLTKDGLAEAFTALGHPAAWVPNRVPVLPDFSPLDLGDGHLEVGVFAEPFWRKNVVTQVGAAALLDRPRVHLMYRPRVPYLDGIPIVEHGDLPWEEFVRVQGSVDLNLYVTLSECQPLTPLESYLAGVPCLASRTSALFRDDRELWELTTVDELDNPAAIARAARALLANRDEAVERARAWMEGWDARAAELWARFVS